MTTAKRSVHFLVLVGLLLVLGLAGCASDGSQDSDTPGQATEDQSDPGAEPPTDQEEEQDALTAGSEITADAVWTNELSTEEYREWETAPGHAEPVDAAGPHGATVQVYINDEAAATLAGGAASEWPRGSVLVKDIFAAGGELQNVAYMLRTGDGWFYAEYDPNGAIIAEGLEVAACADCHAQGSDSVRTVELP